MLLLALVDRLGNVGLIVEIKSNQNMFTQIQRRLADRLREVGALPRRWYK